MGLTAPNRYCYLATSNFYLCWVFTLLPAMLCKPLSLTWCPTQPVCLRLFGFCCIISCFGQERARECSLVFSIWLNGCCRSPTPFSRPPADIVCVCVLYMCTIDGTIIVVVGSIVFCSLYVSRALAVIVVIFRLHGANSNRARTSRSNSSLVKYLLFVCVCGYCV